MQYIKAAFENISPEQSDMLVALLADAGFAGFEEAPSTLFSYIEHPNFHEDELKAIADSLEVRYTTEVIPAQNWNALWESNFPPVIVGDFCTIRAHFHDIEVTTQYEIQITPKMSFGTGHHATTQLMMLLMRDTAFKGATVLDFGTGTGVLAILAELLGADRLLAIDNDEWCVENAKENTERNGCKNITVQKGSLEDSGADKMDIILANINRHILLAHMSALYARLNSGGTILMSGLLTGDKDIIVEAAIDEGFIFKRISEQANWIALEFATI